VKKLIEGFVRFKSEVYPQHRELFRELASQQNPDTLFIACSDSRVVPGILLQAGPGELFVCRNAGNIAPSYGEHAGGVSATIEYAVQVLKVKHVVVCGHSDCGAMKAALHPEQVAHLPAVSHWLHHVDKALAIVNETFAHVDEHRKLELLIEENVIAQLDNLMTHPSVAAKVRAGALQLHGWIYDIPHGEFKIYDRAQHAFVPLASIVETLIAPGEAVNV
jgi:carbonic anhydrase